ncbi:acyl-CoA reductase-like NAD-dependent aldehyde dehydrogenase [Nonomuraea rubra]|uniref:Acyl-CoA reductase-like NAD-dependent aldehyde dehydrogenase n=1 Tax=Nonomuraea rubra TaxID=46180 RepID=A0A7X0NXN5_9ACTN|nr:aldehyde dehydrogenase family protein [Nonomuraea rubra]MBB6551543.1 acyl-CoA reductase-like NAD-dependent aldehyde dehydrogenase [Nonomuraea rubra]
MLLELGGKSASILLDDLDGATLATAVAHCLRTVIVNSGQTCTALTRLVVPRSLPAEAGACAAGLLSAARPGDRDSAVADLGPVISARQRERVAACIPAAVLDGARLVWAGRTARWTAGSTSRPRCSPASIPAWRSPRRRSSGRCWS